MLAITSDCHACCIQTVLFSCSDLPAREHDTRCQPFHIPFPWRGQGFVEVVDVENEPPFRRSETPKIADVAIAAGLNANSGLRCSGEVHRHQGRRTTKKRER